MQREGCGQRVGVSAVEFQLSEGGVFRAQEVVQDILLPGREFHPEVGQGGFQRIHVDALGVDLPHQRRKTPGQGGPERIERFRGAERPPQVARLHFGPDRRRVGPEFQTRRPDAVRLHAVADGDAVQRDAGVVTPRSGGRGLGVEEEEPADRLREESQCREVEPSDLSRHADLLLLPAHPAVDSEGDPQRRVAVFDPSREPLLRQIGFHADPSEVAASILRMGNLQPDPAPRRRAERIEPFALCVERQIEPSERVVGQEAVQREAVAAEFGRILLLPAVEATLQSDTPSAGGQERRQSIGSAVGRGRALQSDAFGQRHPAAQRRVGQDLQQEGRVAEIAPEAGRCRYPLRVERIFRRPVHGQREMPGRGEFETDAGELLQRAVGCKMQPQRPVVQRCGEQ